MEDSASDRVRDALDRMLTLDPADYRAFFESLGFTNRFVDDPNEPRYVVVARDAAELHLQWMAMVPMTADGDRPVVRILVDDVDAFYYERGEMVRHYDYVGTSPFAQPADAPWGTREWHVQDPSGNSLQFYQSVSS